MKLLLLEDSKPIHVSNIIDKYDIVVCDFNEIIKDNLRIKYQYKVFQWRTKMIVINVCRYKVIKEKNGAFILHRDGKVIVVVVNKRTRRLNLKTKVDHLIVLSDAEMFTIGDKEYKMKVKGGVGSNRGFKVINGAEIILERERRTRKK